ncbi:uncharacterized protein LOC132266949 isoform X1 [Cornus florida]|uniref:uncharacterized protein LOC132266949 isoform X1 n=1 Tax=Cornus florida TaxID=4283 RepID=UPI002898D653|nr:uncharacterized protein LOC132266949 isoform X1 [Cornus florida]
MKSEDATPSFQYRYSSLALTFSLKFGPLPHFLSLKFSISLSTLMVHLFKHSFALSAFHLVEPIRFVSCERKIIGLSCIGKGVQRQEGVDSEQKRAYSNIVSPDQAYVIHEDDDDQRCRCRSLH